MTCRFVLLFALVTSVAHADEAALDVFLEQRVAEELAADGTSLSRLGVALDVEVIGDKAIVSLVDPSTRRVVSSTKLDAIPVDREAAVASITQVAANLASRLQPPAPNDLKQALQDERAEREHKEAREAQYKAAMIHFGHIATTDGEGASTGVAAIPFKGDRRLSPLEFFREIERPDLVDRVRSRRRLGAVTMIAGGAMIAVGAYLIYRGHDKWSECDVDVFMESHDVCRDAASKRFKLGMGAIAGGTLIAIVGEIVARRNPISEREVHDLADHHNAKLRKKLQLSPYVDPQGAGFAVSGKF